MKVNIKGKEIELKYTIRSMIMYENMMEKTFNPQGVTDMVSFFYCVVVASCKDYTITLDDVIDYIDEGEFVMEEFKDWFGTVATQNNLLKKN